MSDEAESNLGRRLLQSVENLWRDVNGHGKVLDHHGQQIEALKTQMRSLKSQVHGLKTSKGIAVARNASLRASISEAEDKLDQIRSTLN